MCPGVLFALSDPGCVLAVVVPSIWLWLTWTRSIFLSPVLSLCLTVAPPVFSTTTLTIKTLKGAHLGFHFKATLCYFLQKDSWLLNLLVFENLEMRLNVRQTVTSITLKVTSCLCARVCVCTSCLSLAGGYTPLTKRLCPAMSTTWQNIRKRQHHALLALLLDHKWWLRWITFTVLKFFCCCFFFSGKYL